MRPQKIPPQEYLPHFAECARLAMETPPAESQALQDDYLRERDGPEQGELLMPRRAAAHA